jgi:hypothetical protein
MVLVIIGMATQKKSISWIVATENQYCDDQRFLVLAIFIFF